MKDLMFIPVKFKKLNADAVTPEYATPGSACFDLVATEEAYIFPGGCMAIGLGFALSIPEGYKLAVYSRSGIASKLPIVVANSVGQIDSDYRGEVKVLLRNVAQAIQVGHVAATNLDMTAHQTSSPERKKMGCTHGLPNGVIHVKKGDRIAQGAIERVLQASFYVVDELDTTERGEGGFGSTGTNKKEGNQYDRASERAYE